MNFLRKNAFYVALVGGVVVLVVVFLVIQSGPGGEVRAEMARRATTFSKLAGLGRQPVNENILANRKEWVRSIREKAGSLEEKSIEWNTRNYEVLELQLRDGRALPAFPVENTLRKDQLLTAQFTQKYLDKHQALIDSLHPTGAPSKEEIQAEINLLMAELGTFKKAEDSQLPTASVPRQEAQDRASLKRAGAGWIYVTPETLSREFDRPRDIATFEKLWQAQVQLWVAGDIVAAIRQTNETAIKDIPEAERSVLTAAVKRLVSMTVYPSYQTAAEKKVEGAEADKRPRELELELQEQEPVTAVQKQAPLVRNLTQRVCGKKYDVIYYDFVVIMPTRHLQELLGNLMRQNYHTVLELQMGEIKPEGQSGSESELKGYYYYGPDPVLQVTVRGEALFLTAWERGTWDKSKKDWASKYPPLMPVEMLKILQTRMPTALRPEDNERVKKSGL